MRPHVELHTARKLLGHASKNGCSRAEKWFSERKFGYNTSPGTKTVGPCPEHWSSTLKRGPLNGKLDTRWQTLLVSRKLIEKYQKQQSHDTNKGRTARHSGRRNRAEAWKPSFVCWQKCLINVFLGRCKVQCKRDITALLGHAFVTISGHFKTFRPNQFGEHCWQESHQSKTY